MQTDTTYVAAWPDAFSRVLLELAGVTKRVHLTTCFDKYGRLAGVSPPPVSAWPGSGTARIMALEEWRTAKGRHVIALLDGCGWAHQINAYYRAEGIPDSRPYRPHVTLAKNVQPGAAAPFRFLIGYTLCFDRHGFE